jgi:hypothetical protein
MAKASAKAVAQPHMRSSVEWRTLNLEGCEKGFKLGV